MQEVSKISIEITKDLDTLEVEVDFKIRGNKIDIIEAFMKVLKDKKENSLQHILNAVKEFS